ncbi:hypothetical protein CPHO_03275 [Corynebacterium phocae]|uniref:DUF5979 domain-containing protein n=2 Tax=Corynebacterium phocae TaxID=161895 RepID=A0A1L7D1X5_9CORY|nr:DUF5979 domain-containing protein [Corynebacterium phocae]APT92073.1 hypothetical protein CPHO_03275 [Corynebacterium phocae]
MKCANTRVIAIMAAFVLILVGLAVPRGSVFPAPVAHAAPPAGLLANPNTKFSGCEFRVSSEGSPTEALAPQLCWLDFSQIRDPWDAPQQFSQKIGDLTLEFTAQIVDGGREYMDLTPEVVSGDSGSIFGYDTEGKVNFGLDRDPAINNAILTGVENPGSNAHRPVLRTHLGYNPRGGKKKYVVVKLDDIRVFGKDGRQLDKYDFVVMDAERTTTRANGYHELISLKADSRGKVQQPLFLPEDWNNTCKWSRKPGNNNGINFSFTGPNRWKSIAAADWEVDGNTYDFVCAVDYSVYEPGAFLVSVNNPKSLEVGMYTSGIGGGQQAIAIALNVGRLGGHVEADTSAEQAILAKQTTFDFEAGAIKDAYEAVLKPETEEEKAQSVSQYSTLIRKVSYEGAIPTSADPYVFSSTATTPDGSDVFKRYTPKWTCQLDHEVFSPDNLPEGFEITNGDNASKLKYPNTENKPLYCKVDWEPKFREASLTVEKTVTGLDTAVEKSFDFSYQCTPLQAFTQAFGDVPMSGNFQLSKAAGLTKKVDGLVEGARCEVTEDQATAGEVGYDHSFRWNGRRNNRGATRLTLEAGDAPANRLTATNTYTKKFTNIELSKKLTGSAAADIVPAGSTKNFDFDLECQNAPKSTVSLTLRNQGGTVTTAGVKNITRLPAGAECTLTPQSPVEQDNVVFSFRQLDQDGNRVARHESHDPFTLRLKGEPNSTTRLAIEASYMRTAPVIIQATTEGPGKELGEAPTRSLDIGYRCELDGQTVKEDRVSLVPGTSAQVEGVPVGATCTTDLAEGQPYEKPRLVLEKSTKPTIQVKRADNRLTVKAYFDLRSVPVRVVNIQHGAPAELHDRVFENTISCKSEDFQTTTTVGGALSAGSAATDTAPTGGDIAELPAGAQCSIALSGNALEASPLLDVTAGDRKPYSQFGLWSGQQPADANPDAELSPDTKVTAEMKAPTLTFTTPKQPAAQGQESVMTIAAETFFAPATADVTFTKEADGAAKKNAEYSFTSTCGDDFTLRAGKSHVFADVPVGTTCTVTENVTGALSPVVSVSNKALSEDYRLDNVRAQQATANKGPQWIFDVKPVAQATDTATSGDKWKLVATNTIPGIALEKDIKGGAISAATKAVAGTVMLPGGATTMELTYRARNLSTAPLENLTLKDPSLAGYEISADGATHTVGQEGDIPAEICQLGELAGEAEAQCTFTVAIPGDADSYFHYKGSNATITAGVVGAVQSETVTDTAATDAIRLSAAVAWMLPESGMQTLVLFLGVGILLLLFGLRRYLRREEEELA